MTVTQQTNATPLKTSKRADFRELLRAVIKESPKSGEIAHKATFKTLLKEDGYEEYLDDLIERALQLNYNDAVRAVFPPTREKLKSLASSKRQERNSDDAIVADIKARVISRLLDMQMPNGKKLRFCTGKECADAGGWLAKIAERVKPRQIVGEVLTEEQLAGLLAP